MIKVGSATIESLYVGSTKIASAYVGSTLIYSSSNQGGSAVEPISSTTPPQTSQNGSFENPFIWDNCVNDAYGNRKHTLQISTESLPSYRAHYYIYLESGKSYRIGEQCEGDGYIRLFNLSGNEIQYDDDSESEIDNELTSDTMSPVEVSESGWYILCLGAWDDRIAMTVSAHCEPEPGP